MLEGLKGIKDRLGFGGGRDDFDQEFEGDYDAYSDNYDDFSSYDDHEEPNGYSSYAPVTTRGAGSYDSSSRTSSYSSQGYGSARNSHPRLVSYDDVRASTQIPESLNRDPLPLRRNSVGRASDYMTQPNDDLYGSDTPRANTYESRNRYGSSYDSAAPAFAQASSGSDADDLGASQDTTQGGDSYDPYQAYERGVGAGQETLHKPTRKVTVIAPVAYNEVENVARMLKAGDVVVLTLHNTPSQLSKRVLDFSFGVASALDASVDCISDKVFAITQGQSLTDAERLRLRGQGVI